MKRDSDLGLTPFFVMATLGTTGSCSFDDLASIGEASLKNTPNSDNEIAASPANGVVLSY